MHWTLLIITEFSSINFWNHHLFFLRENISTKSLSKYILNCSVSSTSFDAQKPSSWSLTITSVNFKDCVPMFEKKNINTLWMYEYMILMMSKKNQTRFLQRISITSRLIQGCFNKQSLTSRLTQDQALPQNKVFPRHPRLW